MKRIKPENTTTVLFEYVCESSENIEHGVFFENWVSAGELWDWDVEQTVDVDEDGDVMYYYWVDFTGFLPGETEEDIDEEVYKVTKSIVMDKRCYDLQLLDAVVIPNETIPLLDDILNGV